LAARYVSVTPLGSTAPTMIILGRLTATLKKANRSKIRRRNEDLVFEAAQARTSSDNGEAVTRGCRRLSAFTDLERPKRRALQRGVDHLLARVSSWNGSAARAVGILPEGPTSHSRLRRLGRLRACISSATREITLR